GWKAAWPGAGVGPPPGAGATLVRGAPTNPSRPYFSRQNVSRPSTGGIVSKSCGGGGDDVRHSSVRPSQGSARAAVPARKLRRALSAKSSTPRPMPKAPTVDAKLAVVQPASGG